MNPEKRSFENEIDAENLLNKEEPQRWGLDVQPQEEFIGDGVRSQHQPLAPIVTRPTPEKMANPSTGLESKPRVSYTFVGLALGFLLAPFFFSRR